MTGGVLKVEPGELVNLVTPLVPVDIVDDLAKKVNQLLCQGKYLDATNAVDVTLLETGAVLGIERLERLKKARNFLFLRRRQHRKDVQRLVKEMDGKER